MCTSANEKVSMAQEYCAHNFVVVVAFFCSTSFVCLFKVKKRRSAVCSTRWKTIMWRMYASPPLFIHVFKSLEAIVRPAVQHTGYIDSCDGNGGNMPIKYVFRSCFLAIILTRMFNRVRVRERVKEVGWGANASAAFSVHLLRGPRCWVSIVAKSNRI